MDIHQHNNILIISLMFLNLIYIIQNTYIHYCINILFMELHILVHIFISIYFLMYIQYQFINNPLHIKLYHILKNIHIYNFLQLLFHIILYIIIFHPKHNNYNNHHKHYHIEDKHIHHYINLCMSYSKYIIKFHHNLNNPLHILVYLQ